MAKKLYICRRTKQEYDHQMNESALRKQRKRNFFRRKQRVRAYQQTKPHRDWHTDDHDVVFAAWQKLFMIDSFPPPPTPSPSSRSVQTLSPLIVVTFADSVAY